MITAKKRLMATLGQETQDRPPCICPGGMMNMVTEALVKKMDLSFIEAHHNPKMMADLAQGVYDYACFENYGLAFCMTIEAEAFGAEVAFGNNRVEPHVSKYMMTSVSEYGQLPVTDHESGRSKVVLEAIGLLKERGAHVPIIGNITGPISTASSLMEPVSFYKELRKKNEEAHAFMAVVTKSLMDFMTLQIQAGADVIAISDPSGTGEILGPKLFEEFTVPYINQLVDQAKLLGVPTIVHICGQMKNVYGQVDKIESHALSFDALVNMKEVRKQLSTRCIMGNLSTYTLEFGRPSKVSRLTQQCMDQGVDIVSPACGLGMGSPLENIQAVLKTVKEGSGNDNR